MRTLRIFVTMFFALLLAGCASTQQQRKPPTASTPPPALQQPQPTSGIIDAEPVFVKPSPLAALSASPYPTFKAKIDSLIPDTLFPPAHMGLKVVSLKTREVLYELNAHSLFNPASNQKLFTAAVALSKLGETFPLATAVYVDPAYEVIFIKGFGDAVLSTENVDSLARIVEAKLPKGKSWHVVGDVSYFDDQYWGYGWNWDDEPEAYQMFLSPLIVNGNTIKLIAKPGRMPGDKLDVATDPLTGFVSIENNGITARDTISKELKLTRKWRERLNTLVVDGAMLTSDREESYDLSLWQPERYVTTLFAERLQKYGVNVRTTGIDTLTFHAYEVARFSHPLDSVVTYMNKVSDNLSAETLLKVLAAEKKVNPGSAEAGVSVVKEFLAENGVDTNRIRIVDGSGLSRMNLTSPAVIVRLLETMYDSEQFEAFYKSLPIAGGDGTIRGRFRQTSAEGNLRAKTGTLSGVTSLSGYVQTADGEWLAFSMMMMNYPYEARVYRRVQDQIGVYLSKLRRESF